MLLLWGGEQFVALIYQHYCLVDQVDFVEYFRAVRHDKALFFFYVADILRHSLDCENFKNFSLLSRTVARSFAQNNDVVFTVKLVWA